MAFQFKSLKQILDIFIWNEPLWATDISEKIWKSKVIVHKYLKELVKEWKLKKIWTWPTVRYISTSVIWDWITLKIDNVIKNTTIKNDWIKFSDKKLLDDIFLKFSADWKIMKWYEGFLLWCIERNLNPQEKLISYISIYNHIQQLQNNCWLLNAREAFWKDFKKVYLDEVYYADQYKRMDFGRWKLAEMTFYWKQSQNKSLIIDSINEIIYRLECLINSNLYSAIAIIPWSLDRKNQFLKILKDKLKNQNLPFVNIIKYYPNNIPIPQKTLKTREQRIQNAKNTIYIDDKNITKYNSVLLIDDFVWSWSTLNETAQKLKDSWLKKVDWFAFVWNLNLSYDIINEI